MPLGGFLRTAFFFEHISRICKRKGSFNFGSDHRGSRARPNQRADQSGTNCGRKARGVTLGNPKLSEARQAGTGPASPDTHTPTRARDLEVPLRSPVIWFCVPYTGVPGPTS